MVDVQGVVGGAALNVAHVSCSGEFGCYRWFMQEGVCLESCAAGEVLRLPLGVPPSGLEFCMVFCMLLAQWRAGTVPAAGISDVSRRVSAPMFPLSSLGRCEERRLCMSSECAFFVFNAFEAAGVCALNSLESADGCSTAGVYRGRRFVLAGTCASQARCACMRLRVPYFICMWHALAAVAAAVGRTCLGSGMTCFRAAEALLHRQR